MPSPQRAAGSMESDSRTGVSPVISSDNQDSPPADSRTGVSPVVSSDNQDSPPVDSRTGVSPVIPPGMSALGTEEFRRARRHLPHFQQAGATYFVTFRTSAGGLAPEERRTVLEALLHWHGERWHVHAAVVMPDHVHLLVRPLPLPEISEMTGGPSAPMRCRSCCTASRATLRTASTKPD
jgi:hypothetical protein